MLARPSEVAPMRFGCSILTVCNATIACFAEQVPTRTQPTFFCSPSGGDVVAATIGRLVCLLCLLLTRTALGQRLSVSIAAAGSQSGGMR